MAKGTFLVHAGRVVVFLEPPLVVVAPGTAMNGSIAVTVVVTGLFTTLVILVVKTNSLFLHPFFGTRLLLWFV